MLEVGKSALGAWLLAGCIGGITLPLFLIGLGDRNIWIPLEARYALVAREIWEGGSWVLPHIGGHVYPDKPPLLFWLMALASASGSEVTEWTARLPSALAAVGVCLLTWHLGRYLFSAQAGVFAALILATSTGFFWSGRQALPDMLLTFWTTGAYLALWIWVTSRRPLAAPVAGLCMGLATLTKGPVGFLLPTLSTLAYLIVQRDWQGARGRDLLSCLGTYFGVTLAWYLPASWEGGLDYVQATLLHHSLQRYVQAWEHQAPWYFYAGAFPAGFLPWVVFLPQALVWNRKLRVEEDNRGWRFTLCWLGVILVFFSLSSGKRDIYILPAFPAAALLVGMVWSRWWEHPVHRRYVWQVTIPMLVLALAFAGLGLWMLSAAFGLVSSENSLFIPPTPDMRLWVGLLLLLAGLLVASAALLLPPRYGFGAIAGCTWLTMVLGVFYIYTPRFNQRYPIDAFAATIQAAVRPGTPLHLCGPLNDLAIRFNLRSFVPALTEESRVTQYLHSEIEVLCVMEQEHFRRLSGAIDRPLRVVARQDIHRSALVLISNQP